MPKRSTEQLQDINERMVRCADALQTRGQTHVLRWWDELQIESRQRLLSQLEAIPWETIDPLLESVLSDEYSEEETPHLEPADAYARSALTSAELAEAVAVGRELLAAAKVVAFTVAGGQGTRLGFPGPKGAVKITPVAQKCFFQLFAEMVAAARATYSPDIAWYIMTSPNNHEETLEVFQEHDYFGLPPSSVFMFPQGMLPSFDFSGKLLMAAKDGLALSPDGHGGSLRALHTSGTLREITQREVEVISYFQVDNPLVNPFDELFIGLHKLHGSEMSTKVARKQHDLERVGNLCRCNGKVQVIEYSDLPDELARARNADGTRKFDFGNLAIHLFDVDFVSRMAGEHFELPHHRAIKAVPYIDERGTEQSPDDPNGIKFETFVFDALPLAKNPLLLEVERSEEFSPVKNASGSDSISTATRDQILRAVRWLEAKGCSVPRTPDGEPDVVVEIAPSCGASLETFLESATTIPSLQPGDKRVIE